MVHHHRGGGRRSSGQGASFASQDQQTEWDVRVVISFLVPSPQPPNFTLVQADSPASANFLNEATEKLRGEFRLLAEQWRVDTQHLSQISKKVIHPSYLRIIGMGEAAVPLILEELRDRPAHWFAALQSTTNANPVSPGSSPAASRDAWLAWGRGHGFI